MKEGHEQTTPPFFLRYSSSCCVVKSLATIVPFALLNYCHPVGRHVALFCRVGHVNYYTVVAHCCHCHCHHVVHVSCSTHHSNICSFFVLPCWPTTEYVARGGCTNGGQDVSFFDRMGNVDALRCWMAVWVFYLKTHRLGSSQKSTPHDFF